MISARLQLHNRGRALRDAIPRDNGSTWHPAADRRDPVEILIEQDADRLADLVPIRYGRMSASPFAFLRGAAAVMAADLATMPNSGLIVQACGDAHLVNFGTFASAERRLVFDINDFDETLPAPWELDIRRLAASVVVAARDSGLTDDDARNAVTSLGRYYRTRMRKFAVMRALDVWYSTVEVDTAMQIAQRRGLSGANIAAMERKASKHDSLHAMPKLSELVGDQRQIREQPPLIRRLSGDMQDEAREMFSRYINNLPEERRQLISRYSIDDLALKVVGVGSVGTRCFVVLLHGSDEDDPLVLQVKQAYKSVLESSGPSPVPAHHGHRVVLGQRKVQGVSDIFLGWTTGLRGRHYYWRQLWDAKSSIDPAMLDAAALAGYGQLCAWALARAHARTGHPAEIAGYLGKSDAFELALTGFAMAYADQNERDHAALLDAIKRGRVPVETGV